MAELFCTNLDPARPALIITVQTVARSRVKLQFLLERWPTLIAQLVNLCHDSILVICEQGLQYWELAHILQKVRRQTQASLRPSVIAPSCNLGKLP